MFRKRQSYFFFILISFLMLIQVGCTQKKTSDNSSEKDFVPKKKVINIVIPEKDDSLFTSKRSEMCASFHTLLSDTLKKHLLRNFSDKNILLQNALSYIQTYPTETGVDYDAWLAMKENDLLIELPQSTQDQCTLIEALSEQVKFNLNLSQDNDAKLIETYLTVYQYFLTFTDGGLSKVDYSTKETSPRNRLGLIIRSRPDYSYPLSASMQETKNILRTPNYLFIQAVHPRSVLNQYRQELVGQYIVAICSSQDNCTNISEQSFSSTLKAMGEQSDTEIILKLYDPEEEAYQMFSLPFEQLYPLYAYSYTYPSTRNEDPIFVLKIRSFRSEQLNEDLKYIFKKDVQRYIGQFGSYPKNIVIDLRNNGGGRLDQAERLAEYFLPKNTLISSLLSTISDRQLRVFKNNPDAVTATWKGKNYLYVPSFTEIDNRHIQFKNKPSRIIVLLNRGSASTSEVFAAAMKDHQAAMIIGERSYGKGIGQASKDEMFADISLNRSLIQVYFFSPLGFSHFLNPDILDKEHINPYDQSDFTNIAQRLSLFNFNDPNTPIAKNPGRLDLDIELNTQPLLDNELFGSLYIDDLPQSCRIPEDLSLISEEDDCFLDISDIYFSQFS